MLAISFAACGGGTSGTDGGGVIVKGLITETDGSPAEGVTVSIRESGDSASTDSSGAFLISSALTGNEVTLELERNDESAFVSPISIDPANTSEVQITVSLSSEEFTVNAVSVEVIPLNADRADPGDGSGGGTPPPTDGGARPSPTPTPELQLSIVRGTILGNDGNPLAGARIEVVSTGDSDRTDSNGAFRIDTDLDSGSLELSISYEGFQGSIRFGSIPDPPIRATVNLIVEINDSGGGEQPSGGSTSLVVTGTSEFSRR